jgi:hypothetical protein
MATAKKRQKRTGNVGVFQTPEQFEAWGIVHGFCTTEGVVTSVGEPVEDEKWFVIRPNGKLTSGKHPLGFPTEAEARDLG